MPAWIALPLLAVALLGGFLLGLLVARDTATPSAPRESGAAAISLPPDIKELLMALTPAAQTIVDGLTKLPSAIDAYTAGKITEAETALTAQHAEDLDGIAAAAKPVSDKVASPAPAADPAPAVDPAPVTTTDTTDEPPAPAADPSLQASA